MHQIAINDLYQWRHEILRPCRALMTTKMWPCRAPNSGPAMMWSRSWVFNSRWALQMLVLHASRSFSSVAEVTNWIPQREMMLEHTESTGVLVKCSPAASPSLWRPSCLVAHTIIMCSDLCVILTSIAFYCALSPTKQIQNMCEPKKEIDQLWRRRWSPQGNQGISREGHSRSLFVIQKFYEGKGTLKIGKFTFFIQHA